MRFLIALLSLAAACPVAAAEPTVIPLKDVGEEALIIPAAIPVRFTGFEEQAPTALFDGRFVLRGTLVYGCMMECNAPLDPNQLEAFVVPDPEIAAMLPSWKLRGNAKRVYLFDPEKLVGPVVTRDEQAALLSGKAADVRKHVDMVVDEFRAAIECDSPSLTARFVELAAPPRVAQSKVDEISGCG
jgi:hypothetical protein